jgi:hypothetical protein
MSEQTVEMQLQRAHTMIGKRWPVTPVQRLRLLAEVRRRFPDRTTEERIAVSDEAINRAFIHWVQTGERKAPAEFVAVLQEEIEVNRRGDA